MRLLQPPQLLLQSPKHCAADDDVACMQRPSLGQWRHLPTNDKTFIK
jgi:hypothetical protein